MGTSQQGDDAQSMDSLKQFLEDRARALEASASSSKLVKKNQESNKVQGYQGSTASVSCINCSEGHKLHQCDKFKIMSYEDKQKFIKIKKLCFNCLRPGHNSKACKSKSRCQKCKKLHHTLLHTPGEQTEHVPVANSHLGHEGIFSAKHILPTVEVSVMSKTGIAHKCRALLDSGSELTFISEECVQRLQLKRLKSEIIINGIGCSSKSTTRGKTDLTIVDENSISYDVSAFILPRLTAAIPSSPLKVPELIKFPNIKLSDPNFAKPSNIDIIIGIDLYEQVIGNERTKVCDGIYARKTVFEWTICGSKPGKSVTTVSSFQSSVDFDLKQFWELEEIPKGRQFSKEEEACEQHFVNTTKYQDNRFTVKLPFKQDCQLGESLDQANRRFNSLEKRLDSDPELKSRYKSFIDQFVETGHMEEVPANETRCEDSKSFYLPHHCVFKHYSTTTNLRVVFDGSAKTSTGRSLNDTLMIGPTVQDDLYSIIMRFRVVPVALSADIEKMYRQVALDVPDKDFHRIIWRERKDIPVRIFRMTRVTYGIASSSFQSNRCLKEVSKRTCNPNVQHHLEHSFYVDDFLGGANSVEDARKLIADLQSELLKYGFPLRKWVSSCSTLIKELPDELRETTNECEILSDDYKIKALGIIWKPNLDIICFKRDLPAVTVLTKRSLLSATAKLYDPMGWLSPIIIVFKILLQQIWLTGVKWDKLVPEPIKQQQQFLQHYSELKKLSQITMPRAIVKNAIQDLQLHVFCDASEKAYAAVIYARTTDVFGNVSLHLITLKRRLPQ